MASGTTPHHAGASDDGPDGAGEPRSITESLDALLRSLKAPNRTTVASVFGSWEEAVGPSVAAHARPVKLSRDRLVVEVDEPAWATQLRFLEPDLLARLAEVTGTRLEGIDLRVARPGTAPRDTRGW